jgi:hypothetical protein
MDSVVILRGFSRIRCYAVTLTSWRVIVSQRRDWTAVIERLNRSREGYMRIRMGSPGSAQVTRCRLLEQWNNVEIWTNGAVLHLRLRG